MKRYAVDFEIEAEACLVDADKELLYKRPDGTYEIHVRDLHTEAGIEKPLLSVQVMLDAEDMEQAKEKSLHHLGQFLDLLTFVSSAGFRIHKVMRTIDWTPGEEMRRCHLYHRFPDPNIPVRCLDDRMIESIRKVDSLEIPTAVRCALRWFAAGVRAVRFDDQFQYLWFAIEDTSRAHQAHRPRTGSVSRL